MRKAKTTKKPSATAARSLAANAARALALKTEKLDALVARIRRREARITEDFYDIGEALRTIRDDRLRAVRARKFEDLRRGRARPGPTMHTS